MKIKEIIGIKPSEQLLDYLNTYDGEIPILLKPFTDSKKHKETIMGSEKKEETIEQYRKTRQGLIQAEDKGKYREEQLEKWINENPEFLEVIDKPP